MYLMRAMARVGVWLAVCGAVWAASHAQATCMLGSGGAIRHVVHVQLDSIQFQRDNPNVPSDLEQMPHLLGFLRDNGTLATNHRPVPAAHTAANVLTMLTGLYGDRMGVPGSNSYKFFQADGSIGTASSFAYWTSPGADGRPHMLAENGGIAPAPWVPFTRAGCDVGAFAVANLGLENVAANVALVFGPGSKEAAAARSNPQRARADFLGIAIHCAQGSPICSSSHAVADVLPDEAGGYAGFRALFGDIHVQPAISPGSPVRGVDGTDIRASNRPDDLLSPDANASLGYAAAMLEAGIPVVYIYVGDAHQAPAGATRAFGPGEAGYVARLAAYDAAFAAFFERLARRGIDAGNTLFVVGSAKTSHFVGDAPAPATCDGVTVPCSYASVGEIDVRLDRLLATQRNNVTVFQLGFDETPAFYIRGNPRPADPVTRILAQDVSALAATNPITGKIDTLTAFLVDRAAMKLLHMTTASAARTPSFVMLGDANYFGVTADSTKTCAQPPACTAQNPRFAWSRGDVRKAPAAAWISFAGPGVRRLGFADDVFSDHADIRPTLLALLGLRDSYPHDGRMLAELIDDGALPTAVRRSQRVFTQLAQIYKRINAPAGEFGRSALAVATHAIKAGDTRYGVYLENIGRITRARDAVAREINSLLGDAAFARRAINVRHADELMQQALALIDEVDELAGESMR